MRINQTVATPGPVARPTTAPIPSPAATTALAGDTRQASAGVPGIVAHVNGRLNDAGALALTGQVSLTSDFLSRILRQLTQKSSTFGPSSLVYDAKTNSYTVRLPIKWLGKTWNVSGRLVTTVDHNQPAVRLEDAHVQLGGMQIPVPFAGSMAAKRIANALHGQDIGASTGSGGLVRIDPTSLLQRVHAMPSGVWIDPKATQFSASTDRNGTFQLALRSSVQGPDAAPPMRSTGELSLDGSALMSQLQPLLSPSYRLSDVSIGHNALTLKGTVSADPVNQTATAFKALFALLDPTPQNLNDAQNPVDVRIPLTTQVQLNGSEALLTPSLPQALDPMADALKKAGISVVKDGDSLRMDIGSLGKKFGLTGLQADNGVLSGKASLDIPSLISSPTLRGDN